MDNLLYICGLNLKSGKSVTKQEVFMDNLDTNRTKKQKIDRRVSRTRRAIKNALLTLMKTKGISNISVSELSETADINRKTFYMHYQSVTNVLEEIENELISDLKNIICNFDFGDNPKQTYHIFMGLNQLINQNFEFYQELIRMDESISLIKKIKQVLKDTLLQIAVPKIKVDHAFLNLILEYITSGIVSMYIEWFYSEQNISLENVAKTAGQLVFDGLKLAKMEMEGFEIKNIVSAT